MPSSVVFFPIKEFVILFLKTLKLNNLLFKLLRFVLILLRTRDEIFVLSIKQTQQISPKKWPLTSKEGRMLFTRYNTTNTPPFIFTRIRYCESFFMTQMINCFFEDCLKSSKTWHKNYKNLLSRNKRQQLWKPRVKWYMWRIWTIIKSKENWHDAFAKNRNEGYLSEGYWKYHFLWYFFVVGIFRF